MLAEAFKHFKKEQRGFLALFVCLKTLSNILRRYSEAFQHYSTSMQADFKPFLRLIEAVKAFQYEPAVDCSQMVFNAEKNPQRIKNLMPYTLFSRKGWLDLTVFLKKNCKKTFFKSLLRSYKAMAKSLACLFKIIQLHYRGIPCCIKDLKHQSNGSNELKETLQGIQPYRVLYSTLDMYHRGKANMLSLFFGHFYELQCVFSKKNCF